MTDEAPKKVDPAYPSGGGGLGVGHDAAVGTVGAAASFIAPFSGPLVQALIKKCIQAPLEVRRSAWFNMIGEGLRELQDRLEGFDPNRLDENEEFVSIVYELTQLAMKTHRRDKLIHLRAAVLNSAIDLSIDDIRRGTFIQILDRYSSMHLTVLKHFTVKESNVMNKNSAPGKIPHHYQGQIDGTVTTISINLDRDIGESLFKQIVQDLSSDNILTMSDSRGARHKEGKFTSEFGEAFIRFISDPLAL